MNKREKTFIVLLLLSVLLNISQKHESNKEKTLLIERCESSFDEGFKQAHFHLEMKKHYKDEIFEAQEELREYKLKNEHQYYISTRSY